MNELNPFLSILFSPCLQRQRKQILRPAFLPSYTLRSHNTCRQRCLTSLDQLYASKTTSLDQLQDDDLVALPLYANTKIDRKESSDDGTLRLCVIRNQQFVYPLVRHEDDVETDLFLDPKFADSSISLQDFQFEDSMEKLKYYGVGWYGQRPVPSLGGGPGYGADATEIWTIEEEMLEQCLEDGVEVPVIDVGIAHGEKARGGALF